jgi:hypothetical protein
MEREQKPSFERARATPTLLLLLCVVKDNSLFHCLVLAVLRLSCSLVYNEGDPQSPPQIFGPEPDRSTLAAPILQKRFLRFSVAAGIGIYLSYL